MRELTNRQKQAVETKQKIFYCAVSLFAQKSYENVTVQDICDKAEVSVGAFYHHFKSKENIINEGYRLFDQQSENIWEQGHPKEPLAAQTNHRPCFFSSSMVLARLVTFVAYANGRDGVPAIF